MKAGLFSAIPEEEEYSSEVESFASESESSEQTVEMQSYFLFVDIRASTRFDRNPNQLTINNLLLQSIKTIADNIKRTQDNSVNIYLVFFNEKSLHKEERTSKQANKHSLPIHLNYQSINIQIRNEGMATIIHSEHAFIACSNTKNGWRLNFEKLKQTFPDLTTDSACVIWSYNANGKVRHADGVLQLTLHAPGEPSPADVKMLEEKLSQQYNKVSCFWDIDNTIYLPILQDSDTVTINPRLTGIPDLIHASHDNPEHYVCTSRSKEPDYFAIAVDFVEFYKKNQNKDDELFRGVTDTEALHFCDLLVKNINLIQSSSSGNQQLKADSIQLLKTILYELQLIHENNDEIDKMIPRLSTVANYNNSRTQCIIGAWEAATGISIDYRNFKFTRNDPRVFPAAKVKIILDTIQKYTDKKQLIVMIDDDEDELEFAEQKRKKFTSAGHDFVIIRIHKEDQLSLQHMHTIAEHAQQCLITQQDNRFSHT